MWIRYDEHYLRSSVALTCRWRRCDTGAQWRMCLCDTPSWCGAAVRYGGRCGTGVVSRGQTQTRRRLPPDEAPVSVSAPLYLRTHSCTSLYHNNVFAHCSRSIALPLGLFLEWSRRIFPLRNQLAEGAPGSSYLCTSHIYLSNCTISYVTSTYLWCRVTLAKRRTKAMH